LATLSYCFKIDLDKNPSFAASMAFGSVPTLMFFKMEKWVWKQSGVIPAHELVAIGATTYINKNQG